VLGKNGENEMISSKSYTSFKIKQFSGFMKTFLNPQEYMRSLTTYGYTSPQHRFTAFQGDFSAWCYTVGLCHHYFIEDGLEDFFESSVKEVSESYFGKLPNEKYNNQKIKLEDYCSGVEEISKPIALHFTRKSGLNSFLINRTVSDGEEYIIIDNNKTKAVAFNPKLITTQKVDDFKDGHTRDVKIVLGFSLYADAFPELIHPHIENVKKWKIYNGERSYISKGEEAKEDCLHSVSPHYRRGHFKLLTHERYKKKRGQVIFTRGTFVKGKAFDVVTD
jgi:hypothetical protein